MTTEQPGIKKETLYLYIIIAFLVGFIAGAVFAVYKLSPSTKTIQGSAPQQAQVSNELGQAILNLEGEVTRNPDSGEAWTRLGNLYYDTDQPKKAIGAYSRALELIPPDANVITDLGVMYRRDGQPQKAVEAFIQAGEVNPLHEQSRLNQAIVFHYDLHDHQKALAVLAELLTINPSAAAANGQPITTFVDEINKSLIQTVPQQ
ncbi:MAG: tetratricopeptide repeat protein [Desulfobulbaceae bacterium]|uniref:Tetratricopeptide repeat protein n=1 Tax=Candidatus Desulfatifera sulfidica TaxID=2841691 RepID=A0A8J6NAK4_9BACT|nr:tetratricopeptide repeat protein [Candidatus Desulfatifera sulfidica]